MISQYYRYERKGDKEERRRRGEGRKTGQERAISNKIEKSGSPLPTIKDRRNTYTTHIYSPSNPRMANGSVKFPISFPDQREYPTFPSPVSTTLSHIHDHTQTRSVLDPGDTRCKDVSFGSLVFRYESRIPNWTGSGKRNNEEEEEEEARRRRWHQGGNFTRNFCYPSLTPSTILVQGPWRHLFLESVRIPDIRLSCYANRYIQESRTFLVRDDSMDYVFKRIFTAFDESDKLKSLKFRARFFFWKIRPSDVKWNFWIARWRTLLSGATIEMDNIDSREVYKHL